MIDIHIKDGLVIDGSGNPGFYASVLIEGDKVLYIEEILPK